MKKPQSPDTNLSATDERTCMPGEEDFGAQLSATEGVEESVSSVALDRGLLALAGQASSPAETGDDANFMLRVKAGDDAAFDYLVQKYRRAIVSFMFRMTHN